MKRYFWISQSRLCRINGVSGRTTALARLELRELIWLCGNNFIYCDTDSVYFWGDIDFSEYNRIRKERCIKNRACAVDPAGIVHYMGIVEEDEKNGPYKEFKTLGAKKYAYRDKKGVLHITISGVVKEDGAKELERAGGLAAFQPGFVFREAGGMDVIYQDDPIGTITLDERQLYVGTGAVLIESTYTTSLGKSYAEVLENLIENGVFDIFRKVTCGERIDNGC